MGKVTAAEDRMISSPEYCSAFGDMDEKQIQEFYNLQFPEEKQPTGCIGSANKKC
jgi:hypothetical protein